MTQSTAKLSVTPETFTILPSSAPDSVLQITNVSFVPILYRALSTAPKQFQVRPRQGIVQSGQSASITISYNAKAVDPADEAKAERKEDFKIEYCQLTTEHQEVLKQEEAAHGDSTAKITELIKASAKGDKKSRVVSCIIRNKDDEAVAPKIATETTSARPSANRASQQAVDAKTDILTGANDEGLRSRASQAAPATTTNATAANATNSAAASVEKPRPSVSSSTPAPKLPEKKAAANGALVSPLRDPVGYLKQNPIIIVGIVLGLYIIFKIIF